MKEDYLWDKTGEPDPEIQELEGVLGALRYQPRHLEIPAGLAPGRRSTFQPRLPRLLAIAATIGIMLLGVGLWFGLQKARTTEVSKDERQSVTKGADPQPSVAVKPSPESNPTPVAPSTDPKGKPVRHRVSPGALSNQLFAGRRPRLNTPKLTPEERQEAEAAKTQLMLALRVASTKLNFAQKKAQEINSENQTRNQHKVG
jgi:hypothetical protein